MKWVMVAWLLRVHSAVWRGQHQQTTWPQHPPHLAQECGVVSEMLDRLEAHDHVYRRIGYRQRRGIATAERDALRQIVVVGVLNGGGIDINSNNASRYLSHERTAIA